jgi:hypothetical protein
VSFVWVGLKVILGLITVFLLFLFFRYRVGLGNLSQKKDMVQQ